ncbi:hypothetical protein HPB50_005442 [Hyalomma asiaticum]|uniref:Uncharacterized protein n=1 Tax=Hyalomma asiaticum TaxID=266040 RepID=A0ACB7STB6_HYAAI|nr:hypothetical protein HPB50_005442 [Hyalomma asiaticum]
MENNSACVGRGSLRAQQGYRSTCPAAAANSAHAKRKRGRGNELRRLSKPAVVFDRQRRPDAGAYRTAQQAAKIEKMPGLHVRGGGLPPRSSRPGRPSEPGHTGSACEAGSAPCLPPRYERTEDGPGTARRLSACIRTPGRHYWSELTCQAIWHFRANTSHVARLGKLAASVKTVVSTVPATNNYPPWLRQQT